MHLIRGSAAIRWFFAAARRALASVGVPLLAIVWSASALAAGGFTCPAKGTIVVLQNGNYATFKVVFHGADAQDPLVCNRTYFPESAPTTGTDASLFLNYYNIKDSITLAEQAQLAAFFAGQQNQVSVDYKAIANSGVRLFSYHDSWKRLGMQTLQIGGRQYAVDVLQRVNANVTTDQQGTVKIWYDRASGLFLKSSTENFQYFGSSGVYHVVSVTPP